MNSLALSSQAACSADEVRVTEQQVTCPDGHQVRCCWPSHRISKSKSALIHYHGGGMTSGSVDDSIPDLKKIVAKTGVPIFSVDYTLAPTARAPTQVIEGYAALNYLVENREFGIDPKRIGVMGESAGGGLAACLVHWTMEYPDGPKFIKQVLIYRMLDARNITPNKFTGQQYWSHADNKAGWKALLGETSGNPSLPVTSAAGRMTIQQAKGLPSINMDVGEQDIFRDECIDYCSKLAKAGVSVELHVLPGLGHGFDGFRGKPAVEAVVEARYRAIRSI